MVSINAARTIGMMKASRVDRVIVNTTVMPKSIAFPKDSRLLEKSRQHLFSLQQTTTLPCVITTTERPQGLLPRLAGTPMPSSTGG